MSADAAPVVPGDGLQKAAPTAFRPETATAASRLETAAAASSCLEASPAVAAAAAAAAGEATSAVAPGGDFAQSASCEAVCSNMSQHQQQRTAGASPVVIMNERRKRDRPEGCRSASSPRAACTAGTPRSAAADAAAEAALHTGANSRRPQRPRRPPRKFDAESEGPDISLKKALEKSLLETRRLEVDYASLPTIPEIKIASFDEFRVNPVAFYERLERYGREFGGVKVVPPEGWKPPFCLRDLLDDALEFHVRAQDIHKLMQGEKFRHPAEPERASGLQAKDREMKQRLFGTEKPVLQQIETLYWQSVETSSPELTVHYAADLKTNELGSGFPTDKEKKWRVLGRKTISSHRSATATSRCCSPIAETGSGCCSCCCGKLPPDTEKCSCRASELQQTGGAAKKQEANVASQHAKKSDGGHEAIVKEEGDKEHTEKTVKDIQEEATRMIVFDGCLKPEEAENTQKESTRETEMEEPPQATNIASGDDTSCPMKTEEDKEEGSVENKRKNVFLPPTKGKDSVVAVTNASEAIDEAKQTAAFYALHPWNLTRFARQQGSLLSSYHRDVAGVTSPWLYVGMIFSTFCWHAEDNYFAACNYHHWGDAKVWYIIPPSRATSVERMLQRYLNTKDSDYVLHSLTVQLPPSLFVQHRVPVYRVEQKENEFIILWPRTYHAGFNAGFNCNEACNFAPASWLPWGHRSIRSYRFMRSTCIPFHQLLLRAACTAEGLAASQLLHLCQAVMRLLLEEYALRRAAKEQLVATGLMFLDSSQVSQLDELLPDAGGVGAELLSCRRELEHIVGNPLLPHHVLSSCTVASKNGAAICRNSNVAESELSHILPLKDDAASRRVVSLAKNPSAREEDVHTQSNTRSFLDAVADVASLPVKDCDNCRSCCAVSCFTCPHTIEHNCLECLDQQTCSCKLQVALIRFSLPVLWAVFDHVRSLFLLVCKKEEEAATQSQNSGDRDAGNNTACKESARQRSENASSNVEEYDGNGRDEAHVKEKPASSSLPDAAKPTQSGGANMCGTWAVGDGPCAGEGNQAFTVKVITASDRTNQSLSEEGDAMSGKTTGTVTTARSLHVTDKPEVSLLAKRDPDSEAVHERLPDSCHVDSTSSPATSEGGSLGDLLPQQEADAELPVSRNGAKLDRRTSQHKRAHRGGSGRNRESSVSGGGQGPSRNRKKEDELLQDPLYASLPSLEELVLFEETARLLGSFSEEYSKCKWEEEDANRNVAVDGDNGRREDGGKGAGRRQVLPEASEQEACVSAARTARDRTTEEPCSGKTSGENEDDFALDVSAPSHVTFEEKRGSLFMRGENWSLTAEVSHNEAQALEMVKVGEIRANLASKDVSEDGGTQEEQLTPTKPLRDSTSSRTSRECSPSSSSRDMSVSQLSRESLETTHVLKSRRMARRTSKHTAAVLEDKSMRGTEEKNTGRRRRNRGQNAKKMLDGAEQGMMTLVRQLTWRYFLSALKDEEEDNDERILPVFRKAGMPGPTNDILG